MATLCLDTILKYMHRHTYIHGCMFELTSELYNVSIYYFLIDCVFEAVLLCSPAWHQIHYTPVSGPQVLGFQGCVIKFDESPDL